ncbi:MAG TPA: hypothetical protein VIQ62_02150 [Burkholderiales bacterium]
MGAAATFLKCLIPRILLSVIFSWCGYLGSGGDPEAYHILGKYLKQTLVDPAHASLDTILAAEGFEELDPAYEIHALSVERIREPESFGQYLNTVIPIVMLHAASYCVWDHPLTFVLLNSVLSAFAITRAVSAFRIDRTQSAWLTFNPVSIYFAATHYKESIAESLVIAFTTALYGRNRPIRALFWVLLMFTFRASFAGLLGAFYLFKFTVIGRLRPIYIFGGILLGLAVLPPFFNLDEVKMDGAGVLYSLVYRNEYTIKLLGPLLGLLLPVPIHIVLAHWKGAALTDPGALFTTIYGIFYYIVGIGCLINWRYARRSVETNRLVNTVIFVSLIIGYLFLGASGVKDRYFAPFLPLMILALIEMLALRTKRVRRKNQCANGTVETIRSLDHAFS